jgi:bifunctional UDP-N-acetylglucosamine pyrophosphorylase/glucosamine-1-phosphate N-acetyltransferase
MTISAIVLAAGAGTRMRSNRPKPLHRICGRSMVLHVIHALEKLAPERTVVVIGHAAEQVSKTIQQEAPAWARVAFAEQPEQRGTGDAAAIGMSALNGDDYDDDANVLILPGDTPLLRSETLDDLVAAHVAGAHAATVLTSVLDDPTGYGRIVRADDGRVLKIVEQRDASEEELAIKEWNTGVFVLRRDLLAPALRKLTTDNVQGEFYLTDVIGGLARLGHQVGAVTANATETQGVNDRLQLALAEREFRNRTNRTLMLNGVTMVDPQHTFIDVDVSIGRDVTIFPGTVLRGDTVIGRGTDVGPNTQLDDCVIGDDCVILHSVGVEAEVGDGAIVGPFAHLPSSSSVGSNAVTGAFYTGIVAD